MESSLGHKEWFRISRDVVYKDSLREGEDGWGTYRQKWLMCPSSNNSRRYVLCCKCR